MEIFWVFNKNLHRIATKWAFSEHCESDNYEIQNIIIIFFFRYKQTNIEFNATLDKACDGKRSIFIGALRDSLSEEDLEQYFSGFGRVVR